MGRPSTRVEVCLPRDCALPRDPDANCFVDEVGGKLCLVAARAIAAGDALAVPPSDSEGSSGDEEEAELDVPGSAWAGRDMV